MSDIETELLELGGGMIQSSEGAITVLETPVDVSLDVAQRVRDQIILVRRNLQRMEELLAA